MTEILLFASIVLVVVVLIVQLILLKKISQVDNLAVVSRLDALDKAQERTERAIKDEVILNRNDQTRALKDQRQELNETFKTFGDTVAERMADAASTQKGQLDAFTGQLASFAKASGERLDGVRAESATAAKQLREEVVATLNGISEMIAKTISGLATAQNAQFDGFANHLASFAQTSGDKLDGIRAESAIGAKQLREEVIATLKGITESTTKTMSELANLQKAQLEAMSTALGKLSESNDKKLEEVRITVESKLQSMQADNAKQLEQMRLTVDD